MRGIIGNTRGALALVLTSSLVLSACGHSEEEWQAQLDKYNQLSQKNAATEKELADLKAKAEKLRAELEALGFKLSAEGAEKQHLLDALDEYKERAAALERIKERFETLRKKLESLTALGLKISIRKNRMVISLPGDVLFASGKAELQDKGEDILGKVAKVIREDSDLAKRSYQVAGHTDNDKIASAAGQREFKDNWGLSLMRARTVLLFLTASATAPKSPGGGLDSKLWSAAGYGDTDPVASNSTPAGQQKNRRVELIMLPNVEEMLDLKSLTSDEPEPAADATPAPAATTPAPAATTTPAATTPAANAPAAPTKPAAPAMAPTTKPK